MPVDWAIIASDGPDDVAGTRLADPAVGLAHDCQARLVELGATSTWFSGASRLNHTM